MRSQAGRCAALFPGAFRPPHVNHFATVAELAERDDVDDVIVIISNRSRLIPGTDKALDVNLAEKVWAVYLRDMDKVRIEVAPTSAVSHAIHHVESGRPGDSFLLVVGRKDYDGRGRFAKLDDLDLDSRVNFTIVPAELNLVRVDSTELRRLLAADADGRTRFIDALPGHLDAAERHHVWSLCRSSMIDQTEIAIRSIGATLRAGKLGRPLCIEPIDPTRARPTFGVTLANGGRLIVKYANDDVSDDGERGGGKPRRRVKAEKAALKWLRRNVTTPVVLPQTLSFDKTTRTLVETSVCTHGRSLAQDLADGRFVADVARAVASFLASAHFAANPPEPFWDDPARDLIQWRARLELRTGHPGPPHVSPGIDRQLSALGRASDAARTPGFRHLDFTPGSIRLDCSTIGVVDFERATTIGDPAFDLGTFLGHLVHAGIECDKPASTLVAIEAAERAYKRIAGTRWLAMAPRVVGFTAATLLQLSRPTVDHPSAARATALLSARGCSVSSAFESLTAASPIVKVSDDLGLSDRGFLGSAIAALSRPTRTVSSWAQPFSTTSLLK